MRTQVWKFQTDFCHYCVTLFRKADLRGDFEFSKTLLIWCQYVHECWALSFWARKNIDLGDFREILRSDFVTIRSKWHPDRRRLSKRVLSLLRLIPPNYRLEIAQRWISWLKINQILIGHRPRTITERYSGISRPNPILLRASLFWFRESIER